MVAVIAGCQDQGMCVIRMKEVADFAWDRMYVFKYTASSSDVQEAIGTQLKGYTEFHRRIVFMDAGRVVLHEEEPTNVEHPVSHEVIFDIPDTASYKAYSRNAEFMVSKVPYEGGFYYKLLQVR